ncbi:MAG TPA: hypothetical protein DCQ26_12940 [Marinilabiliales bacterium]|jgi:hypothetical protein|nr:MAG: hypothetical protein A2W95_15315 [Bacteroidetes bacterium GWA2_40_14]OFX63311.1 MAG: hypothetical protein A2W84_03235 [Bacteroidetes bacterium GWC2_40_13]OFX74619.1 MAG: hypothetical protein A2W96_04075 [Bacteroidetes bacterium GWD2_40_43]OFX88955.1 MAG: hypothetical protein A2W97_09840 [Bacteroidetes bacterium GWE2_40_63]OFY22761.1 MAG: hypothetical protein A2W88_00130 [Bacteroidetes bacterium GWF2_40_13]OFZ32111.1 MAG: hypothetical protein A2437_19150 [Bacteroidetes bacterium RIFOXYC
MNKKDALFWIEQLQLEPHPEGGSFAQTYQSGFYTSKELNNCRVTRRCASLIYFLLQKGEYSHFHRLQSDEIWLYQQGGPLTIYMITPGQEWFVERLGPNPDQHENLQVLIPAGSWFAAHLDASVDFCLMSCLVSPGFEWEDFELAETGDLICQFPQHAELLNLFCLE